MDQFIPHSWRTHDLVTLTFVDFLRTSKLRWLIVAEKENKHGGKKDENLISKKKFEMRKKRFRQKWYFNEGKIPNENFQVFHAIEKLINQNTNQVNVGFFQQQGPNTK